MNVLMCTDGEEHAESAIRFGGRLAKGLAADATVVHVRPPISSVDRVQLTTARKKLGEWDIEIPGVEYLTRANEILKEVGLANLPSYPKGTEEHAFRQGVLGATELHLVGVRGENVRLRLREGDPVEQILAEAEVGSYDLIIVGSHGRKGLSRYFVGSTALRVADLAPCSVLIAKNIREEDNFLMCTDGSPLAEQAEIFGAKLAQVLRASVTILSVAEPGTSSDLAEERVRRAEMILAQMGISATVKVRQGLASEEIIGEAKDHDIVVMGASGSSAIKKFFMGSVPVKVIEYGECPVLVVREKRARLALER
jgi:nucleotide-binding universal stress UspA family protein